MGLNRLCFFKNWLKRVLSHRGIPTQLMSYVKHGLRDNCI